MSVLAGGDYEAIIPKALVNELLALVDSNAACISEVNETITMATAFGTHDTVLAERWDVLAGVVEAVKSMANIAEEIAAIRSTIDTLPTESRNGNRHRDCYGQPRACEEEYRGGRPESSSGS